MDKIIFKYEEIDYQIKCNPEDKMKDIIHDFLIDIGKKEIDNLLFFYDGNQINYEITLKELVNDIDKKQNKINVILKKIVEKKDCIENFDKTENISNPQCKENIIKDIKNFQLEQ